jgi:hypothetical protein
MTWSLVLFIAGFVLFLSFALWIATKIADVEVETSFGRAVVVAIILGIITFTIRAFVNSPISWVILDLVIFILLIKIFYKAALREIALIWFLTGGICSFLLILIMWIMRLFGLG